MGEKRKEGRIGEEEVAEEVMEIRGKNMNTKGETHQRTKFSFIKKNCLLFSYKPPLIEYGDGERRGRTRRLNFPRMSGYKVRGLFCIFYG